MTRKIWVMVVNTRNKIKCGFNALNNYTESVKPIHSIVMLTVGFFHLKNGSWMLACESLLSLADSLRFLMTYLMINQSCYHLTLVLVLWW